MAIRCGRCRCLHENVADVKACYAGDKVAVVEQPTSSGPAGRTASPKQRAFINKMRADLGMDELPDDFIDQFDYAQVRRTIDDLIAQVSKATADGTLKTVRKSRHIRAEDFPQVTDGYYAVPNETGNDLSFFKVEVPTEGDWAGFLFVKQILGGHDPGRVPRATAEAWLKRVSGLGEDSVRNSRRLYGQMIGECGECGRSLTDEVSRAYGIGPVCREKF